MQVLRLFSFVVGVASVRKSRPSKEATGGRGVVNFLYTFGAPHMAGGQGLSNPLADDGCFPGLRLVTKNQGAVADQVDWAPALLHSIPGYKHTRADISYLYDQDRTDEKPCGWSQLRVQMISLPLHRMEFYIERTAAKYPHLKSMVEVALASAYETDEKKVAKFVQERGYGLVASAVCPEFDEVAHLIQNRTSLDCWLTFEGSDNDRDWKFNLDVVRTGFCGLQENVHRGFKSASQAMIREPSFQSNVRPVLGHCRNVYALGHSLGGSLAALFAACAHSTVQAGEAGYDEFLEYKFDKLETKRLPYLHE